MYRADEIWSYVTARYEAWKQSPAYVWFMISALVVAGVALGFFLLFFVLASAIVGVTLLGAVLGVEYLAQKMQAGSRRFDSAQDRRRSPRVIDTD